MGVKPRIEAIVMAVHHRNGGGLDKLDLGLSLLDPILGLDSLDLAEIMVGIERETGHSPFDKPEPPRTWLDVVRQCGEGGSTEHGARSREQGAGSTEQGAGSEACV